MTVQQVFDPGGDAGVRLPAGHRLKLDRRVQASELNGVGCSARPTV